jgi:hypothetical protein
MRRPLRLEGLDSASPVRSLYPSSMDVARGEQFAANAPYGVCVAADPVARNLSYEDKEQR